MLQMLRQAWVKKTKKKKKKKEKKKKKKMWLVSRATGCRSRQPGKEN